MKEIAEDDSIPWNDVVLGIGAKRSIITKDKCIPVVEVRDNAPVKDIWLYIRKLICSKIKIPKKNGGADKNLDQIINQEATELF